MVSFEMNDRKKIGLGLTGFGILFSFLGIIFFFDKGLLAMGNILFVSGVMLTIGLKSTIQFFTKRKNYKGTISFGVGFFLVLIGWPVLGMILESYGFVILFRSFASRAMDTVHIATIPSWLLAHSGRLLAEDSYYRMAVSTTFCDIFLGSLPRETSACVIHFHLLDPLYMYGSMDHPIDKPCKIAIISYFSRVIFNHACTMDAIFFLFHIVFFFSVRARVGFILLLAIRQIGLCCTPSPLAGKKEA